MESAVAERPGVTAGYFMVHVFAPIFVGGMLYLAFRDESLAMFQWAEAIGLRGAVDAMRVHTLPWVGWIPDWVLFSVPDGCWVYSCAAFFARLWRDSSWPFLLFWAGIGPALAIGGEAGQLWFIGVVPGTFDIVDMLAYVGAMVLALWFGLGLTPRQVAGWVPVRETWRTIRRLTETGNEA